MSECIGYGDCLDPNTCEKTFKCKFNCQPKNCPNYVICDTTVPEWLFNCCHGLCQNCDILFGKWKGSNGVLSVKDNLECPICLDVTKCISQPNCNHYLCTSCFKKCYYGNDDLENEPKFPYSKDIELEY